MNEFDIHELAGSAAPDMAAWPTEDIFRAYDSPILRGAYRNVDPVGQLQLAELMPPGTGDDVISMKTQHGNVSLFLDLNRDGSWDPGEKSITDTPNDESVQDAAFVALQAGAHYPLRVDHTNGMPGRSWSCISTARARADGRKSLPTWPWRE